MNNPEHMSIFLWIIIYLLISLFVKWVVSWGGASFLDSWSTFWDQFHSFPEESGTENEIKAFAKIIWVIITIMFFVGLFWSSANFEIKSC